MDKSTAERHYNWCLEVFERELAGFNGVIAPGSSQEDLFEIVPEVLSRLAFKVSAELIDKTFSLALRFHQIPAIRSHISLHKSCESWFRRIFAAADEALLVAWLPSLLRVPLFDEGMQSAIPHHYVWPDPMDSFPKSRLMRLPQLAQPAFKDWSTPFNEQLLAHFAQQPFSGMQVFNRVLVLNCDMLSLVELYPFPRTIIGDVPDRHNCRVTRSCGRRSNLFLTFRVKLSSLKLNQLRI